MPRSVAATAAPSPPTALHSPHRVAKRQLPRQSPPLPFFRRPSPSFCECAGRGRLASFCDSSFYDRPPQRKYGMRSHRRRSHCHCRYRRRWSARKAATHLPPRLLRFQRCWRAPAAEQPTPPPAALTEPRAMKCRTFLLLLLEENNEKRYLW